MNDTAALILSAALLFLSCLICFTAGRWNERARQAQDRQDMIRGLYVMCSRCGAATTPTYAQYLSSDGIVQVMYAPDQVICPCRATADQELTD